MKFIRIVACLFLFGMSVTSVLAADVGVSITVGQPGFYGQIDIGDAPRPRVIYREPIIIEAAPVYVAHQPLYLRVPPGHAKNWRKHCYRYRACGRPVYFVRDDWYEEVYVDHYRRRHGDHHERGGHDDHDRYYDDDHYNGHRKDKKHKKGRGRDRDDD
jgi:hypothetical protein